MLLCQLLYANFMILTSIGFICKIYSQCHNPYHEPQYSVTKTEQTKFHGLFLNPVSTFTFQLKFLFYPGKANIFFFINREKIFWFYYTFCNYWKKIELEIKCYLHLYKLFFSCDYVYLYRKIDTFIYNLTGLDAQKFPLNLSTNQNVTYRSQWSRYS